LAANADSDVVIGHAERAAGVQSGGIRGGRGCGFDAEDDQGRDVGELTNSDDEIRNSNQCSNDECSNDETKTGGRAFVSSFKHLNIRI
jgi:hypothetical protein